MIIGFIFFCLGAGLAALMAHANILSAGGYATDAALSFALLCAGLVIGALLVAALIVAKHTRAAAVAMMLRLLGEGAGLQNMAERTIAARDAQQSKIKAAAERYAALTAALANAEAAKPSPVSHARLEAAEASKRTADSAVTANAAEIGCRKECAKLLQAAADNAAHEVAAAHSEIATKEANAAQLIASDIVAAKIALASAEPPRSATPLSDRTGVAQWLIDLFSAIGSSISVAGLSALSMSFGGVLMLHKPVSAAVAALNTAAPQSQNELAVSTPLVAVPVVRVTGRKIASHVGDFAEENLERREGAALPVFDLYSSYCGWSRRTGYEPVSPKQFADTFRSIATSRGGGVTIIGEREAPALADLRLKNSEAA